MAAEPSPLQQACFEGRHAKVESLLAAQADVNARDLMGSSPLHAAAFGGFEPIVMLLLKAGADVSARDNGGNTALHRAVTEGDVDVSARLVASRADVNAQNRDGNAPLHFMAMAAVDDLRLVEVVLAGGGQPDLPNDDGTTPLALARYQGQTSLARRLQQAVLEPGVSRLAEALTQERQERRGSGFSRSQWPSAPSIPPEPPAALPAEPPPEQPAELPPEQPVEPLAEDEGGGDLFLHVLRATSSPAFGAAVERFVSEHAAAFGGASAAARSHAEAGPEEGELTALQKFEAFKAARAAEARMSPRTFRAHKIAQAQARAPRPPDRGRLHEAFGRICCDAIQAELGGRGEGVSWAQLAGSCERAALEGRCAEDIEGLKRAAAILAAVEDFEAFGRLMRARAASATAHEGDGRAASGERTDDGHPAPAYPSAPPEATAAAEARRGEAAAAEAPDARLAEAKLPAAEAARHAECIPPHAAVGGCVAGSLFSTVRLASSWAEGADGSAEGGAGDDALAAAYYSAYYGSVRSGSGASTLASTLAGTTWGAVSAEGDAGEEGGPPVLRESGEVEGEAGARRWVRGRRLGAGAFGAVFYAVSSWQGGAGVEAEVAEAEVAAKLLHGLHGAAAVGRMQEEVAMVRQLSHPHLVSYIGTATSIEAWKDEHYILMEYVAGGSIDSLLREEHPHGLPPSTLRRFLSQLLRGLNFLHQHMIVHNDLKGANVLVQPAVRGAEASSVKIADFGSAKQLRPGSGSPSLGHSGAMAGLDGGSPYWMSPERIRGGGAPQRKSDVWSYGGVVLEMATGRPPWFEPSEPPRGPFAIFQLLTLIASSEGPPPMPPAAELPHEALHGFLLQCFEREVPRRPSTVDLLMHDLWSRWPIVAV